jgi:hypothetical protein
MKLCPAGLVKEGRSPTVTRPAGRGVKYVGCISIESLFL